MKILYFSAIPIVALLSCTDLDNELCEENGFYCSSPWESNLEDLNDDMYLDALESYYKVRGSGNTKLLNDMNRRSDIISKIISRSNRGIKIIYADPNDVLSELINSHKEHTCNNRKNIEPAFSNALAAKISFDIFCGPA